MNEYCLKAHLHCIHFKTGVAHGLQDPFVHFPHLFCSISDNSGETPTTLKQEITAVFVQSRSYKSPSLN